MMFPSPLLVLVTTDIPQSLSGVNTKNGTRILVDSRRLRSVCISYRILVVEADECLNGIGHFFCVDMGTLP